MTYDSAVVKYIIPKQCFKCGVVKPLEEFYKHPEMADGHLGKCKDCHRADVAANYWARHQQYLAYEKSPDRVASRRDRRSVQNLKGRTI